jgi:hypothetical protein
MLTPHAENGSLILMSMFAFVSFIFYYGVNFHLVGLHSSASIKAILSWDLYCFGFINAVGALHPKYIIK